MTVRCGPFRRISFEATQYSIIHIKLSHIDLFSRHHCSEKTQSRIIHPIDFISSANLAVKRSNDIKNSLYIYLESNTISESEVNPEEISCNFEVV